MNEKNGNLMLSFKESGYGQTRFFSTLDCSFASMVSVVI